MNNTRGFGLHTNNVAGSILISESIFLRSRGKKSRPPIGNARFWFEVQCGKHCPNTTTNLKIISSQFLDVRVSTSGLEVIIDCPDIYVVIEHATINH